MVKILEELEEDKVISIKKLSEALGVGERMIRKYADDIKESGLDIHSKTGPNGGYYITPHTPKPITTYSDKILEAINTYKDNNNGSLPSKIKIKSSTFSNLYAENPNHYIIQFYNTVFDVPFEIENSIKSEYEVL
jgi:biotin operon repressor